MFRLIVETTIITEPFYVFTLFHYTRFLNHCSVVENKIPRCSIVIDIGESPVICRLEMVLESFLNLMHTNYKPLVDFLSISTFIETRRDYLKPQDEQSYRRTLQSDEIIIKK